MRHESQLLLGQLQRLCSLFIDICSLSKILTKTETSQLHLTLSLGFVGFLSEFRGGQAATPPSIAAACLQRPDQTARRKMIQQTIRPKMSVVLKYEKVNQLCQKHPAWPWHFPPKNFQRSESCRSQMRQSPPA